MKYKPLSELVSCKIDIKSMHYVEYDTSVVI